MRAWATLALAGWLTGCAHFQSRPLSPEQTAADLDNRRLDSPQVQSFIVTNLHPAPTHWPPPAWDLRLLALAAYCYHPNLAVARAQWAAAQAGEITAGERPNPTLAVVPSYDRGIPDNPSPWLVPVSVDVPIETAGKRRHRLAQARQLAEVARYNLVAATWQVRSRVRASLLSVYTTGQMESLLTQQAAAQSNVVGLLEGQLAAGAISTFEVTQARVALNTTRLAQQEARRQYLRARAQLADSLGVALRALDGLQFSFAEFDAVPEALPAREVRREALLGRADVRGTLAEYAASQTALQLEIAKQYPDMHLGPGYAYNAGSAGDNAWQLGLSVTLPVLNRNRGGIAEATAKREQVAAHFLAVQAQAIGEIDGALSAYQAAREQSATVTMLWQTVQERLAMARAMRKAGASDALAVANAQVEYFTGALARLDALDKMQQALGQVEDAVQRPLEALGAAPAKPGENQGPKLP